MHSSTDTRIPIVMGGDLAEGDAVLVEDGQDMPEHGYVVRFALGLPGHMPGCMCCTLRGPAADSLSRMFRERATGVAPYFNRVVVLASPEGVAAMRAALENDVVTKARFKEEVAFLKKSSAKNF